MVMDTLDRRAVQSWNEVTVQWMPLLELWKLSVSRSRNNFNTSSLFSFMLRIDELINNLKGPLQKWRKCWILFLFDWGEGTSQSRFSNLSPFRLVFIN